MGIDIVTEYPRLPASARAGKASARIGGAVLIGMAAIVSIPTFFSIAWGLIEAVAGTEDGSLLALLLPPNVYAQLGLLNGLGVALFVALYFFGVRLVRSNRRLVLYLRRFRDESSTGTVGAALDALGGSWRLVTLDDSAVEPMGADPRLLSRAGHANQLLDTAWAVSSAIGRGCFAVAKALAWVSGGVFAISVTILAVAGALGHHWGSGLVGQVFEVSGKGFALAIVIGLLSVPLGLLMIALVPLALLWDALMRAARGASGVSRRSILAEDRVDATAELVRKSARRVYGPRLVVVSVVDKAWQKAVVVFGEVSTAVIIDVSDPSEAVTWEIKNLLSAGRPCVFIGDEDKLRRLSGCEDSHSGGRALARLLDRREVLSYRVDSDASRTAVFEDSLEAMLERSGGGESRIPRLA